MRPQNRMRRGGGESESWGHSFQNANTGGREVLKGSMIKGVEVKKGGYLTRHKKQPGSLTKPGKTPPTS